MTKRIYAPTEPYLERMWFLLDIGKVQKYKHDWQWLCSSFRVLIGPSIRVFSIRKAETQW